NMTLEIAFDDSGVPSADRDNLHIYANMGYEDVNGDSYILPYFGEIDDGVLTITTTGMPSSSTWVIVYNPNMTSTVDASDHSSLLTKDSSDKNLTNKPTWYGGWSVDDWCVMYDATDTALRNTIANALGGGLTAATISVHEMDIYLKENVSLAAKISGYLYADGGFREPSLHAFEASASSAYDDVCTNATANHYRILVAGSSHYTNPNNAYDNTLPFGMLYVGSSEVNDLITGAWGSTFDAVAHEMFHSILAGYDLSIVRNINGTNEGLATTLGSTIGWADYFDRINIGSTDWDNLTAPYVRTGSNSEIFILSNQLNTRRLSRTTSENYSNQDFYAYAANIVNGGKLDYASRILDYLYINLSSRASAASTDIRGYQLNVGYSLTQVNTALSSSFQSSYSTSLETLYTDFVVDRAYDHPTASYLRSTDSTTAGITTALFAATAMASEAVDPDDLDASYSKSGSFANVLPWSSRLLTITASDSTNEDRTLAITISDAAGGVSAGSETSGDIRVAMRGDETGTFSAGVASVESFGDENNTLYILISNVSNSTITINYLLGSSGGAAGAPTLSISGCPSSMTINTSVPITFNYTDADANITTMTQTVTVDGETVTGSGDVSAIMSGTSGSYTDAISYTGSSPENNTVIYTFMLTDDDGNYSNVETCTTVLLAGGD
ncbi:hypothetical protein KKF63_05455, partial [bacterium]|nr:hypothetical protein [bacterium]